MSSLKRYFLTLNFFAPKPDDNEQETDEQRRWNIIATRIYMLLLLLILFAVGLDFSLIDRTITVTVEKPSKEEVDALPKDAKCSCSQISIPYGKFTSLQANFHSLCTSQFITDRWIKAINSGSYTTSFFLGDFRTFGSAQFQALSAFCRLSTSNINQTIDYFYSNTLLSLEVFSEEILHAQTQASISQFQLKVADAFQTQLRLINFLTINNGLISSLRTNAFYLLQRDNQNLFSVSLYNLWYSQDDGSTCGCRVNICNRSLSGIFSAFRTTYPIEAGSLLLSIPGISSGCLPVTSILVSSLECFYNQTCIDQLLLYFPTNERFQAIPAHPQSIYNPESTIQTIVNNLMIENWTIGISYEKYYSERAPSSCTYLQIARYSVGFIIKRLISLLAGLVLILGLLISLVLKVIHRLKDRTPRSKISLSLRLRYLQNLVLKQLMYLNLFQHYPSSERQIRYQCYATRVYLICMIISVIVLAFYSLMIKTNQSKTIGNPTESQYTELERQHLQSLSCPCSSISMPYSRFLTIQPEYHQVCSSDLVSDEWIEYFAVSTSNQAVLSDDFKSNADSQFQLLSMFCKQSKEIIANALELFLQTKFFSLQVIPPESFQVETNSFFQNWKRTTMKTYLTTIQLFETAIQNNQLSNNLNFGMRVDPVFGQLSMGSMIYSDCSCRRSVTCHSLANLYTYNANLTEYVKVYSIPNFFIGCFHITSLLLSTLECFYNISCMLQIHRYANPTVSFNFSALDPRLSLVNETVAALVEKSMVDQWLVNVSFTSYYDTCAPSSCTYQYEDRDNLLIVITTILGIFGGLSLGLKLLIVIGLQFIDKIIAIRVDGRVSSRFIKSIFGCTTEHQVIHRLHFILVAVTLSVIYYFAGVTSRIITVRIDKPSLYVYEELLKKSSDSLHCACSQISIPHQEFLKVTSRFHEICSSEFVSDEWISYLYGDINPFYRYEYTDFFYTASKQFQILVTFCQLSKKTVENALLQFDSTDLIQADLLSFNSLDVYIQQTMEDLRRTMPKLYANTFALIRETIGANKLLSSLFNNWELSFAASSTYGTTAFSSSPKEYNHCSCATSSKCISPSHGMFAGCYTLETILQTPIQCLYNQTCIDPSNTFRAINSSSLLSSQFSLNSTFQSIVNELMLEQLMMDVSYEKYFNACAPLSCTHSYLVEHSIIEGIAMLIDLYGGLFIICRLLSVFIVKQVLCFKSKVRAIND
ncbi:unnamed protein product [Adineta ricciae]|uniref:Uncharacterized protein n=1 Tax=Adineta ricciae TaxID=249248 RepID=A0A815V5T6_ADIRI|nr:unnamed protein product [Adineta ricciae]CAF1530345.1 unnamed protein product [Adineta ricciae]